MHVMNASAYGHVNSAKFQTVTDGQASTRLGDEPARE
jgi:hypothetical protein